MDETDDVDEMADQGGTGDEWVVLRVARSGFEARVIGAVLEDAGIPHQSDGGDLRTDEFAMAQKLMNAAGSTVRVPARLREAAERALAAAREAAELLEDDAELADGGPGQEGLERESPPPRSRQAGAAGSMIEGGVARGDGNGLGISRATIVAWGVAVLFLVMWLEARSSHMQPDRPGPAGPQDDPIYATFTTETGYGSTWRDSGRRAFECFDEDHDGVPERWLYYDRDGKPATELFDADENGVYERSRTIGRDGRTLTLSDDADQDGRYDSFVEHFPDELRLHWRDDDGDGRFEHVVVRQGDGPEVVQVLRGATGFVDER
ncbi:MAG: hypothetical protein IPM29_04065 [Planctomycetes bacterium]|nr:hypothetical protein [Planctomycetota bacterium]